MSEEGGVVPPANRFACGHLPERRSVTHCHVGNRDIGFRSEFEERRIEWKDLFAFRARSFGKHDHAFTAVQSLDDLLARAGYVAPLLTVDENDAHIADDPSR